MPAPTSIDRPRRITRLDLIASDGGPARYGLLAHRRRLAQMAARRVMDGSPQAHSPHGHIGATLSRRAG